jgi:diguanylate cyclase
MKESSIIEGMAEIFRDSAIFFQVFDMVDIGLVILDRDLHILHWNRWMELHSSISPDKIVGSSLYTVFPNLKRPRFLNGCKAVLAFGNFCFFSQKLHQYLFPFKPISSFDAQFEYMQQNCTMGPLRNAQGEVEYVFIAVHDVTETVNFERKLMAMNLIDALTGINNRRSLEMHLKNEYDRYKRYGRPLSLIMFDIDHFKRVNDTHGHQCGDHILITIAALIQNAIRSEDLLARYGGEEFCCLLPETSLDAAMILAERFRSRIDKNIFYCQEIQLNLTISLGVSTASAETATPELLLKKADEGLYAAKESGRNRIVVAN